MTYVIDKDNDTSAYKPPVLNPNDYRDKIQDLGLTIEQENEFLNAIFKILEGFVLNSWQVDSASLIIDKIFENAVGDSDK